GIPATGRQPHASLSPIPMVVRVYVCRRSALVSDCPCGGRFAVCRLVWRRLARRTALGPVWRRRSLGAAVSDGRRLICTANNERGDLLADRWFAPNWRRRGAGPRL